MIVISDTTPIVSLIKEKIISTKEIKSYLEQLRNSSIRLSESLIQEALSMLK